jgi:hypothetical protein
VAGRARAHAGAQRTGAGAGGSSWARGGGSAGAEAAAGRAGGAERAPGECGLAARSVLAQVTAAARRKRAQEPCTGSRGALAQTAGGLCRRGSWAPTMQGGSAGARTQGAGEGAADAGAGDSANVRAQEWSAGTRRRLRTDPNGGQRCRARQ